MSDWIMLHLLAPSLDADSYAVVTIVRSGPVHLYLEAQHRRPLPAPRAFTFASRQLLDDDRSCCCHARLDHGPLAGSAAVIVTQDR